MSMHCTVWQGPRNTAGWLSAWEAAGGRHSDSHHRSQLCLRYSPWSWSETTSLLYYHGITELTTLWLCSISNSTQEYLELDILHLSIFRFSPNKHLAPIYKVWCVLNTLCPRPPSPAQHLSITCGQTMRGLNIQHSTPFYPSALRQHRTLDHLLPG